MGVCPMRVGVGSERTSGGMVGLMDVVISAWSFPAMADAANALAGLATTDTSGASFADAVAVTWAQDDKPRWVQMAPRHGGAPHLDRHFWDLTVGLVFQVPLLRTTDGGVHDALLDSDSDIDRSLVNRLRDELIPDTSALLIMGTWEWIDRANDTLRHTDAKVVYTFKFSPKFAAVTTAAIVPA